MYGIDNLNEYYDPNLKADRLKELKNLKILILLNFLLENFNSLKTLLENHNFDTIIQLAAQVELDILFKNQKHIFPQI